MQTTHTETVGQHVNEFVNGLKSAIVTSMAAAAEGVRLEAEVARITQRMQAFHSVLEAIDAQKQALSKALSKAESEAQRQSLRFQLGLLDEQTVSVLCRSGVEEQAARQSVARLADDSEKPLVNGASASNGHAQTNGQDHTNGNGHGRHHSRTQPRADDGRFSRGNKPPF